MSRQQHFTDYDIRDGVVKLPTIKGYTVDMRLREFRRVHWDKSGDAVGIDFIPFDSTRGMRLLERLYQTAVRGSRLWNELSSWTIDQGRR